MEKDKFYQHVGHQIRVARAIEDLNQEELGQKIQMKRNQISYYETARLPISTHNLYRIAKAMDKPIQFFFPGE